MVLTFRTTYKAKMKQDKGNERGSLVSLTESKTRWTDSYSTDLLLCLPKVNLHLVLLDQSLPLLQLDRSLRHLCRMLSLSSSTICDV